MDAPQKPHPGVFFVHGAEARAAIGRGSEVVLDGLRGRVDLLSPPEVTLFTICRGAGTLDELAERAVKAGFSSSHAAVRAVLSGLVARGALVSESELLRLAAAGVESEPVRAQVASLGVPTRDRAVSLRRSLSSYAEDIAARGRSIEIVVQDDATSDEGAARAKAIAVEVARRTGVPMRFADRVQKRHFAEEIARASGAPREVVLAALAPEAGSIFAAGAARNALMLDSSGGLALQIDDDTVCDLRAAPGAIAGVRARSFDDPTEMWFDEEEISARGRSPDSSQNEGENARTKRGATGSAGATGGYVETHERLLGRRAGALLLEAQRGGGASLGSASPALIGRIASGGRVVCTQLGIRGDSAIGTMGPLLTMSDPSRARMLASEAVYRRVIASRRVVRSVTGATLTELDGCMTFAIGLDARSLLPPFPPLDRNEDGLFGVVLSTCDRSALFGHVPVTVVHEPEDVRPSQFELVFEQAGRVGINDVIGGLVTSCASEIDRSSPEAACASLGRALCAWTELPPAELFERVAWMLGRRLAQRLARIEQVLRENRRVPAFWARDLDRLAEVIRERAEDPERAVPHELGPRFGAKARAHTLARIFEYGQILIHWPAMFAAGKALREQGIRLGEVA